MEKITVSLAPELITEFKQAQNEQNELIIRIGQVEYQKHKLQEKIDSLSNSISKFKSDLDISVSWLDTKLAQLDTQYPGGIIDLEMGTVTYTKTQSNVE